MRKNTKYYWKGFEIRFQTGSSPRNSLMFLRMFVFVFCMDTLSFVVPLVLDVSKPGLKTWAKNLRGHRAILEGCQETRQDGF